MQHGKWKVRKAPNGIGWYLFHSGDPLPKILRTRRWFTSFTEALRALDAEIGLMQSPSMRKLDGPR